jgi:diguanylate cyclase (GGDEF)-like protein
VISDSGAVAANSAHEDLTGEMRVDDALDVMKGSSSSMDFGGQFYEPWLFQMMLSELTQTELGVGFIYSVLERLAGRHQLTDVVTVIQHESLGPQMFRLGGHPVTSDQVERLASTPGVYCEPDVVAAVECDAVRTACQLSLSLHHARFCSEHDALTNIANRRSFDAELEVAAARSARYNWAFTLILVDLNDFKDVNDTAGHPYGDYLLRQFGFALRKSVRQGDTAARIGGDEFAVILSNAEGHESLGFTERLRMHLNSAGIPIEFTTGASSSPKDSTNSAELLRIADGRLYDKKKKKDVPS